ncbi:hypothetical protein EMIHUDRAFT_250668 [Emiliania huxleyi CCMP1516]|uniref:Glycine transporter domain-containing protein n=2 Tax=Emiliania huxleyi TaxID=2903 RepID=A0A0D3HYT1_EMIH1|nr:hypothetical protein EMIHUDRAFT_250668 [Emiliania huxleyi CCMP1516]EOD04166.1 hypothetical protein EMIHUDRAFT_250668 [Emiliania huxleyi CCMP1516]|eukprot:XP_005756595.1 hypothetical protein EMIHUDRAFT_250668 [Emiliania huxleyi CCMP1516]
MASMAGTITAGSCEMDLFGCTIVGTLTAIGGGTIRDIILGRTVYWLTDTSHLTIALAVSVAIFLTWPALVSLGLRDSHLAFLWSDALGMQHIGDKYYAAAEPTSPVPLPAGAEYFVPWLFCLLLRAAAWTFRLALPHWARKRQSIFDLRGAPPPLEAQPSPRPIAPSLFPRAVPWTGSLSLEPQKPQFQVGRLLLGPKQRRRFGLPQLLVPKGRRGRRKVPPPADEFD